MKHCHQEQAVEAAKQAQEAVTGTGSHAELKTPTVNLTSFARLHMGFFDLNGGLGRKFGSIGLTLAEPSMQITAVLSDELKVDAASSVPLAVVEKATQICTALLNALNLKGGLHLHLHSHIPSHAGLGSGTQMALSIGAVINRLYGLGLSTAEIASLTARGGRSGIGIAAFDVGGVIIDGGLATTELPKNQPQPVPPLLARYDWPENWRIILIMDTDGVGVHGKQEKEAFKNLPVFPASTAADLCRQMLMQVMPAIVERDLISFGQGVQELQAKIGDYFAPVQGGRYASQSVAAVLAYLANSGVACFGQSSWGPTGFAVCETANEAESLVESLKNLFKNSGLTYLICSARNAGAHIDEESNNNMMKKVSILHLITPAKNASPFDANMAFDADFERIMPYTNVTLNEVTGLVQDAIFSRSPDGVKREGIFIGGRDIDLAMDMLETAKKATFPPFEVSMFADPSGAFTTAAAMVAKVEFYLRHHFKTDLKGKKVAVFGATGPVGGCVAVISAKQGAQVVLVAHSSLDDARLKAESYNQRYGTNISYVDGVSPAAKQSVLDDTNVALCCAAAGIRVITAEQIAHSNKLQVVADVNAVAPTGAEGVDVYADGVAIATTPVLGVGALAIGNLKYQTQHQMLESMLDTDKPLTLDFLSAFETATRLLAKE